MLFRQAQPAETQLVAGVLSAAAANLWEKGHPLWSLDDVNEIAVGPHVRDGRYSLALDGGNVVGVFRLDLEDRLFWPEIADGSSAFLHKLAVVPGRQGGELAQALLRHACELTRELGRPFLRLDCASGRPKLRAVYERFGFSFHSHKMLGDRSFDRFELSVGGPARL
jgi:GNAT superfamily N-acetyltransferase